MSIDELYGKGNNAAARRQRERTGRVVDPGKADEADKGRDRAEEAVRQRAIDEDPMLRDEEERRYELPR